MPVTAAQLIAGANYQLATYAKNDPIDQFTKAKPFSQWLIDKSVFSSFGNGLFNEKVRKSNDSNYQNYQGDDQVSYNKRDPDRLAAFQHYEAHDGFTLNETELANNGIIMTDDREAQMSDAEAIQIVNLLKENRAVLKNGFQDNWDLEMHRNGSTSTKACPGLDAIVTVDGTGVLGGLDPATSTYWKNYFNTGIAATAGLLTAAMETAWRACMTVGGMAPDGIFCGSKAYDAYRADALQTINRQLVIPGKGGTNVDNSVEGVYFKGVQVIWDPTMDTLQALDAPSIAWDKRMYFLQSKSIRLRKVQGRWMIDRTPPRIYDRYTHYFGKTADYGLTCNQRNCNALLSIA